MEQQPSFEPSITPPVTSSSLIGRLTNVFVSPTEVFDEVKVSSHKPSNWVLPLFLLMIITSISTFIMFSQPGVLQPIKEAQEKEFQKMVKTGQMKQNDVDKIMDIMQKWMGPISAVSSLFISAIMFFATSAVVFFFGRVIFKSDIRFTQSMEITGLASMIMILGTIVMTLLVVIYGKMGMTLGPILLIGNYDHRNKLHAILSVLNLPALWYIGVLALGLSRVSGATWWKAFLLLFAVWAVVTLLPAVAFAR